MKLLYFTDTHFRLLKPINRVDNFVKTQLKKLAEVLEIAHQESVDIIVHGGDLFDRPKPDYKLFNRVLRLLKRSKIPIYAIPGNHDIVGHKMHTLQGTAFWGLVEAHVIYILNDLLKVNGVTLRGIPYGSPLPQNSDVDILIVHSMIVPKQVKFEHTLASNINYRTSLVLAGHYHIPFTYKSKHTTIINPGSLLRLTVAKEDMERIPSVVIVDNLHPRIVPLRKTALPFDKVFSLKEKVDERVCFDNFFLSLDNLTTTEFNLIEILKKYKNKIKPEVLKEAIDRVSRANG